ncbi:MAG TPA: hypothetical protein VNO18_06250 [Xanthobacteraceae bacterium]|nr:hypothetical protein [Xanthobacteraceae bacterium]
MRTTGLIIGITDILDLGGFAEFYLFGVARKLPMQIPGQSRRLFVPVATALRGGGG